jgi:hypothetical protein
VRPTQRDNVNVLASETQVHHGIHAHMGSPRVCVPRLLQPCLIHKLLRLPKNSIPS